MTADLTIVAFVLAALAGGAAVVLGWLRKRGVPPPSVEPDPSVVITATDAIDRRAADAINEIEDTADSDRPATDAAEIASERLDRLRGEP